MSEPDKCRQAFEKKFGVVGTRLPNGNYSSWAHQMRWDAFQAAWNPLQTKVEQLKGQLERAGFTDNGGELMKPPIGMPPRFDLLDELRSSIENLTQKYKHDAHASSLFGAQDKARVYNRFANELEHLLKGSA